MRGQRVSGGRASEPVTSCRLEESGWRSDRARLFVRLLIAAVLTSALVFHETNAALSPTPQGSTSLPQGDGKPER